MAEPWSEALGDKSHCGGLVRFNLVLDVVTYLGTVDMSIP